MSQASFIAEVSSNHGCDLRRALAFIEAARVAGCSGVKFQQFRIDELFAPEALAHDPKLGRRREWELPVAFNEELAGHAHDLGLLYSSTPFYRRAIAELEPWVDFYKISSYQLLWLDFLREVAATGKPVVLATGMADLHEVAAAVEALAEGGCSRPTLLHCVSLYPTAVEDVGLSAMETMRARFDLPIGWSDHSARPEVIRRAVLRHDASLIEFHLDLDRAGAEFDFGHCWLPEAISAVIEGLEHADPSAEPAIGESVMDGDGRKRPVEGEAHERIWRSDPLDGLRPIRSARPALEPLGVGRQS